MQGLVWPTSERHLTPRNLYENSGASLTRAYPPIALTRPVGQPVGHPSFSCCVGFSKYDSLSYHALYEKNWLREEDRLGDFTRPKRLQNLVGTEIAMDAA